MAHENWVRKGRIPFRALAKGWVGTPKREGAIFIGYGSLLDTVNSPKYPWLLDLPGYLASLSTIDEPERIKWVVRKSLMEDIEGKTRIGESSSENWGILANLEAVRKD